MLAEGVAVRTIMETLGHAGISMTMDVYGHVTETTLRDAADRMDRALGATNETPDTSEGDDDDPPAAGSSFAVDVSFGCQKPRTIRCGASDLVRSAGFEPATF